MSNSLVRDWASFAASRIFRPAVRHTPVEGQYRPGPYLTGGGWLPASWGAWNFWQMGYRPQPYGRSAMVQACISAYAQTIAMCPGSHKRTRPDGGVERVTNSALSRILKRPNSYQTPSDFFLNATSRLYDSGNAYALALRNDRFEIAELHLMDSNSCGYRIATTGDVFYNLTGNEIVDRLFADRDMSDLLSSVPERDVLHIRLETPRHPLKGETPLTSALLDLAASNAAVQQTLYFFENQSRPSGTLNTDEEFDEDQVNELRDRWERQTTGVNAGRTPILTNGLKWNPMSTTAKDSNIAEMLKLTDQNIALAFRVPLQILGVGGTPFASTEALNQSWIASGLGFALNHIELSFDRLFGIDSKEGEYTELDTSILLRSAFKDRMDALTKAVQGGILAPNEARRLEGYADAVAGDEPRVQKQVVPLSQAAKELALQQQAQEVKEEAAAQAQIASTEPDPNEESGDDGDERDWESLIRQAADRHRGRVDAS